MELTTKHAVLCALRKLENDLEYYGPHWLRRGGICYHVENNVDELFSGRFDDREAFWSFLGQCCDFLTDTIETWPGIHRKGDGHPDGCYPVGGEPEYYENTSLWTNPRRIHLLLYLKDVLERG